MLIWFSDIKPTNIMIDSFRQSNGDLEWRNVQITDLEAAVVLLRKAKGLTDRLSRNYIWRSPEAWARGIQNTPSDIYSFAIVAIFARTGRMVFFSDEANRASPGEQAELIVRRHLSFFANDMEDFEGFIAYHEGDDNPFVKREYYIPPRLSVSVQSRRLGFHRGEREGLGGLRECVVA
ncbi:hypothetical protein VTK26DRAFT_4959 [Humicola hyalothermophila]